jgi:hypothetical protein
MTDTSTVDRSQWATLLDRLTKEHEGELVTIELLDPTYGDLREAERLPFAYLTYDSRDDVVIVAVGGRSGRYPVVLRHIISSPTDVDVAEGRPAGAAVRVIDAEGTPTLVTFLPHSARREPAASAT